MDRQIDRWTDRQIVRIYTDTIDYLLHGVVSMASSLYSTATQNCLRWEILRYLTQKIVLLHDLTQKIPTCWYFLRDANFLRWPCTLLFCVCRFHSRWWPTRTPFPVEYRLRWVPNAKILRLACTFHVVCVSFICVWYPTQTQFQVEYMGIRLWVSVLWV